jgi:hypothetical protein
MADLSSRKSEILTLRIRWIEFLLLDRRYGSNEGEAKGNAASALRLKKAS